MDATRRCCVEGCERPRKYRLHCSPHYCKLYKAGKSPGYRTFAERLWPMTQVTAAGCWEYTGTRDREGYGRFYVRGPHLNRQKGRRAHRVAWEITNGPIPHGLIVRHRCDNPPCCNPDHLELGTQADNMRDRSERGNAPQGEGHPQAKLSARDVRQIREAVAAGARRQAMADSYGVSYDTISRIVTGKNWASVA